METLLTVAIVVIGLAVVVQAGVLLAMYLMSRRLATNVEGLMADGRRLVAPLESVTTNLKAASNDLAEASKSAREQAGNIQLIVGDARQALNAEIADVRARVNETVEEARETILSPIRQWSAVAKGVSAGIRTFFKGRRETEIENAIEEEMIDEPLVVDEISFEEDILVDENERRRQFPAA
jgi:hypothetical protein